MDKQRSFIRPSLAVAIFGLTALGFSQLAESQTTDSPPECPTHVAEIVCHTERNEGLARAEAQYRTCATCHGQHGEGGIGPSLLGLPPEYVYMRMTQYKQRETVGPQSSLMWSQVVAYSEDDLRGLAEYVSRLRPLIED